MAQTLRVGDDTKEREFNFRAHIYRSRGTEARREEKRTAVPTHQKLDVAGRQRGTSFAVSAWKETFRQRHREDWFRGTQRLLLGLPSSLCVLNHFCSCTEFSCCLTTKKCSLRAWENYCRLISEKCSLRALLGFGEREPCLRFRCHHVSR